TRDPNLGKVVLYQLSYFRVPWFCAAKLLPFFELTKFFGKFFQKFFSDKTVDCSIYQCFKLL
ncbi:MAG: hypothetical protein ACI30S_09125, partial [Muribaculaceae bacterium]